MVSVISDVVVEISDNSDCKVDSMILDEIVDCSFVIEDTFESFIYHVQNVKNKHRLTLFRC